MPTYVSPWFVRSLGLIATATAIGCIFVDLLMYFVDGSYDLKPDNLAQVASEQWWRCRLSGNLGVPVGWGYLAGCLHIYLGFQPGSKPVQAAVFIGMVLVCTNWGMIHTNYVALAATAGLARDLNLDMDATIATSLQSNNDVRIPGYAAFAVVSLFYIPAVWTNSTHFPRWMLICYPLPWLLISTLVQEVSLNFPANVYQVIVGAYFPFMMTLFWGAGTIAIWNAKISVEVAWPTVEMEEDEEEKASQMVS